MYETYRFHEPGSSMLTPLCQEMNEQQGSRGEANFVWKCQNCKVSNICSRTSFQTYLVLIAYNASQRQHSATVLEGPKSYPQQEPAKAMNILTMDCRGLEFVDFKADVSLLTSLSETSIGYRD
jgi:hypothetical protein